MRWLTRCLINGVVYEVVIIMIIIMSTLIISVR